MNIEKLLLLMYQTSNLTGVKITTPMAARAKPSLNSAYLELF